MSRGRRDLLRLKQTNLMDGLPWSVVIRIMDMCGSASSELRVFCVPARSVIDDTRLAYYVPSVAFLCTLRAVSSRMLRRVDTLSIWGTIRQALCGLHPHVPTQLCQSRSCRVFEHYRIRQHDGASSVPFAQSTASEALADVRKWATGGRVIRQTARPSSAARGRKRRRGPASPSTCSATGGPPSGV